MIAMHDRLPALKTFLYRMLAVTLVLLAVWGLVVALVIALYAANLLPARVERSIRTGVRMARADWNRQPGRRTRRSAAPTPAPTLAPEDAGQADH